MVKITAPLMSQEAHGIVGERLVFCKRASGQQARFQKAQNTEAPTWQQTDNQSLYRVIYARWFSFNAAEKKVYDDEAKAKNLKMSGWNLFLKKAMDAPFTYLGLVGYWSFNRTGNATVLDLSKNGYTGTLLPTWPTNVPGYVDSKNKKMAKALQFDGVVQRVQITNNFYNKLLLKTATPLSFTISAWFKKTDWLGGDLGGVALLVGHCRLMFRATTKVFYWQLKAASSYVQSTVKGLNTWYYAVGSYNSVTNKLQLYVDGKYVGETSVADKDLSATNLGVYIGYASNYYKGFIDDVRVYNRVLGAPEILKLYQMVN